MQLSIKERAVLFGVLPPNVNFAIFQVVRDLERDLAISDAEKEAIGWKVVDEKAGGVVWDATKDPMKDISLSGEALKLIQAGFRKLDSESALTREQAEVGLRFRDLKAEVVEPVEKA